MAQGKKTGGRVVGTPNRATAEIKAIAGAYSEEAVEILITVARNADSDAAKVAACRELLDRGHGKPRENKNVRMIRSWTDLTEEELLVLIGNENTD